MNSAEKINYGAEYKDAELFEELKRRWDHLERIMQNRNLNAVLIVGNSVVGPPTLGSFRYFTGRTVYFKYQAFIARPGKPIMVFAPCAPHNKSIGIKGISDIRIAPDILRGILSEISENPVKRLGVVLDMLPAQWYLELKKMNIELINIMLDISEVRSVRTGFEREAARISAKIADAGYEAVCNMAKPGVRLTDLHAELDYAMKQAGAEETFTLMSCGRFSFEDNRLACIGPYTWPDDRVVKSGDCVAMEITPRYMGYWTQMVRTICIDEPNPDLEIAHKDLLNTVEDAAPLFKPGMKLEDVMARMCKFGENLGYISKLPFGHIAGIDLDEGWQYAMESDIVLKADMTLVVHPTLITPKIDYGIFWGDSYLVTEDGGECLTSSGSDLLTV